MRELDLDAKQREMAIDALEQCTLFQFLLRDQLAEVVRKTRLEIFDPGEAIMRQGEPSLSFYIVLKGSAAVRVAGPGSEQPVDLATVEPFDTIGEMGLLLDKPRSATVVATVEVWALEFSSDAFTALFLTMPNFGRAMCRALAARLERTQQRLPMTEVHDQALEVDPSLLEALPLPFLERHRVIPLEADGQEILLGFVDDPDPEVLEALYRNLPGRQIKTARIGKKTFETFLKSVSGIEAWAERPRTAGEVEVVEEVSPSPKLDALLRRVVSEGATDLHLAAGRRPYWRVEGELHELADAAPLGKNEVFDMLAPLMGEAQQRRFQENLDEDFGHGVPGLARFRINMFHDIQGVSAALRPIPARVPTLEELGVPDSARGLAEQPSGLVLITGPAASGKTSTLASMVAHIGDTRSARIITIEDPVEFVHTPRRGLVSHREVGSHCVSFEHGFRAALREDPDVVVLGTIPDGDTMRSVLDAAHNGLLVLANLVTPNAVATITHILTLFRPEERIEVQALLAERLKGVVSQALCRLLGGGRVAAFEVMSVQGPISTALREGRTRQIATLMATGSAFGNILMNDALARLVLENRVDPEEALDRAPDKNELAQRLGRSSAKQMKESLKATRIIPRRF